MRLNALITIAVMGKKIKLKKLVIQLLYNVHIQQFCLNDPQEQKEDNY